MTEIIPYKQSLSHSCLVACFMMLLKQKYGIAYSPKDEEEILLKGMRRIYPFYVVGVPKEVFNHFGKKITILVDNKYFTNFLHKSFNDKNLTVQHHKINIALIRKLLQKTPIICHIDDHHLGDYSHASHFVVIEQATEKFLIVDPMHGEKKWISEETLEKAIQDLKKHIKMCPLVFYLS
jgi:hypothetical protein